MNTIESLEAALARINRGWTQDAFARDKKDNKVFVGSPSAVKWCITGALWETKPNPEKLRTLRQIMGLRSETPEMCWYDDLFKWNDDPKRTQEEVITVLEKAIELERNS